MKPFGAQKGHVVDFLFTLALFCVFAASALMVVVIGANVYRQTVRGMDSNYDSRTSLTYLTEKVDVYKRQVHQREPAQQLSAVFISQPVCEFLQWQPNGGERRPLGQHGLQ